MSLGDPLRDGVARLAPGLDEPTAAGSGIGQAFLVLTALTDKPRHGYGIVALVLELSDGRVPLSVGTLYGVLDRLAAQGSVVRDRDETHLGRLRRYYRLTPQGADELAIEADRLAASARLATSRLSLGLAGGIP